MKKLLLAIVCITVMASCSTVKTQSNEKVIEKPSITITNGHFTPEILLQMGQISDPQISPDGSKILYGVTYTDIQLNKKSRQLYLMNFDGSDNHQLLSSAKSISNARWLENGDKIAFLQGGQIHVMNADGTGIVQISNVENGISEFTLSPDQKKVMYVSDFKNYIAPTDEQPDLDKATVRTINDLMYRHWDHYVENIPHTFVASFTAASVGEGTDILDGEPYELPTEPFSGIEQLCWSPDGKYIAYSCRKLTGKEYAFSTNTDIYLYNVSTGECENLTEGMMGYDTDPVFSPDGTKVAWLSMRRDGYESDKVRIFTIDLGSKVRKELTVNFKYNAESLLWSDDSATIYFASLVEGVKEIWKTDLNGEMTVVTPSHAWYDFASPAGMVGNTLITTNTSLLRPAEIVSVDVTTGQWEQLTHENDNILAQLEDVTCEERWIKTIDGKQMLTWVLYPPKFDKAKKYPSLLICLGGPQGTISQGWSTRWSYRLFASQGYVVVLPNRRGTTAFGQEWTEQISGDYPGMNMQDYLRAADVMLAEPYVDKMAAAGASYGGYSVYYLAGIHRNRFSALVAHAGIFNQEHMYMETEEMWFPDWDNGGVFHPNEKQAGAPWSTYYRTSRHYVSSPHRLIKNWNTPILVTHGEKDYRVPYDQGMAAFNAAQMMGVPSKMLLFPDENHWILKPQNSVFWYREVIDWLNKWCK
ncbi:MAG: S9 family peptidase [Bacteroidales bacterium]|nr:S9 family peptidase [Bacteroidales bacterium]